MNLYLCNAPIEFPRSEYGGLVAVIAENKKQCGRILTEKYKEGAGKYFNLSLSVKTARELPLDPAKEYEPGIFMEFVT